MVATAWVSVFDESGRSNIGCECRFDAIQVEEAIRAKRAAERADLLAVVEDCCLEGGAVAYTVVDQASVGRIGE